MTDDLLKTFSETPKAVDMAQDNLRRIIETKQHIETRFIELAALLCQNRDYSLYKILDYDSLEEFLGTPEVGLKRAWCYSLMRTYDVYVKKFQIAEEDLAEAGATKLKLLLEKNPKMIDGSRDAILEWVDKAKVLSVSDLKEEVGGKHGSLPSPKKSPYPPASLTPNEYIKLVKESPCCVCGKFPSTAAHYPRTKVRCEEPWMVIPLCGECHRKQEDGGKDWCWENRQFWAAWFYGNIVRGKE